MIIIYLRIQIWILILLKKLCSDYSKEPTYDCKTATMACSILQHYIESELEIDKKYSYSVSRIINPLLNPIYQMSEYSYEWILSFWERQKECFVSGHHDLQRLAEEIIEYTLPLLSELILKYANLFVEYNTYSPAGISLPTLYVPTLYFFTGATLTVQTDL